LTDCRLLFGSGGRKIRLFFSPKGRPAPSPLLDDHFFPFSSSQSVFSFLFARLTFFFLPLRGIMFFTNFKLAFFCSWCDTLCDFLLFFFGVRLN